MGIFFPFTSQLIIAKIHKSKQPWFPFFDYTIVTCLIFGASLPDGQVHHLARGRNCPLEIRTPEPRTQDEAKKEMSGRVRRRPRSLRGWQRWQVGLRRKRRPPDALLVAKHYLGHGCFLRSLWVERMQSHTGCICGLTQMTDWRGEKRNRIVGQLLRWPWQVSLLHFDDLDILL